MLIISINKRQHGRHSGVNSIHKTSVYNNFIRTAMHSGNGDDTVAGIVGRITMLLIGFITVTAATAIPNAITPSPTLPSKTSNHYNGTFRGGRGSSRVPFKMPNPDRIHSSADHCDYTELLKNMHDRLNLITALEETQQQRLESIDMKILELETNHLSRLQNIAEHQNELQRLIVSVEHQHEAANINTNSNNNNNNIYDNNNNRKQSNESITPAHRWTRQTASAPYPSSQKQQQQQQQSIPNPAPNAFVSGTQKLDALATLLVSTRAALRDLQLELQTNLSKLSQQNGLLQRHINNVFKKQQQQSSQSSSFNNGLQQNGFLGGDMPNCFEVDPGQNQGLLRWRPPSTTNTNNGIEQPPFYVRCDSIESWGNGWLVVLQRFNGDINFERSWSEYRRGFGNIGGEFFIGLDRLHTITASTLHELLFVLESFEGEQRFAHYRTFAIGGEMDDYELQLLGEYDGDAGDSFSYHAGYKFSTFDNDNDGCVDCNCAQSHRGGWWYNWCDQSNLMGPYHTEDYDRIEQYRGIYWQHWLGPNYSLKAVKMLIRPIGQETIT